MAESFTKNRAYNEVSEYSEKIFQRWVVAHKQNSSLYGVCPSLICFSVSGNDHALVDG